MNGSPAGMPSAVQHTISKISDARLEQALSKRSSLTRWLEFVGGLNSQKRNDWNARLFISLIGRGQGFGDPRRFVPMMVDYLPSTVRAKIDIRDARVYG